MTTDPQTDRPEVDDPRVLALAKARQQMAHKNPFNVVCPPWDGLTAQEQQLSLLDARNYLRAAINAGLTAAAPAAVPPTDRAGLRELIAGALYRHEWPGKQVWEQALAMDREAFLAQADAVLPVLPETARLHDEILTLRADQAKMRDLLRSEIEASRRLLEQRQEMAEERYAWQERGDRAEERVRALEAGQAALSDTDRQFLAFTLELAADKMASRGDEFSDDDEAALKKLRRLAAETQGVEPWLTDSARIGRTLIWSWADVGKGAFREGYRAAQAEARALLGGERGTDQHTPAVVAEPGKEA